jgi:NAD(P)-dependent dehydrogenase (short-subunit alcohol dehydrogenase family)
VKGGALVSGGASGLGAAAGATLAEAGYDVVLLDRDLATGPGARAMVGDVADEAAVGAAVAAAAEARGGLRVAVACAGVAPSERIVSSRGVHDLARFEQVLRVNLVGTFNVLRLAAAAMAGNEPDGDGCRGVIVCTASAAAYEPQVGQAAYAASKGGVVSLTLCAARDLASLGIRVVSIAPGVMETPMLAAMPEQVRENLAATVPFPPRLGRPQEFGSLVEAIVGNPYLNGETIRLDGALRMPPR